jgi:hypothetical protein
MYIKVTNEGVVTGLTFEIKDYDGVLLQTGILMDFLELQSIGDIFLDEE